MGRRRTPVPGGGHMFPGPWRGARTRKKRPEATAFAGWPPVVAEPDGSAQGERRVVDDERRLQRGVLRGGPQDGLGSGAGERVEVDGPQLVSRCLVQVREGL